MLKELREGVDMHSENQKAFNLPSRLIAKVLVFRTLYGGTGYSFAKDPDFMEVSTSEKFWSKKIEAFYEKYKGFRNWHTQIVKEAMEKGQLVLPTGRIFKYEMKRGWNGELQAPETIIKNYPVNK